MKATRRLSLIGILITAGAALAVTGLPGQQKPPHCKETDVILSPGHTIRAEIADTPSERSQGLSNRETLPENRGMLFLFRQKAIYSFWMKDTYIPLDIIWLNNKTVTEIVTLEPENGSTVPQHTPKNNANAVLELNKGQASAHGVVVGSQLQWPDCP